MKRFRGLLSAVLALTMVLASFAVASAKSFSDVDATKYSWCADEIAAMADDGIITGYTDGTFKPENVVTKIEALALVARVLGSRDEVNEILVDKAVELYGDKVEKYKLSFGDEEVCYLLLKGVIFESELDGYIGNDSASEGMKRYEIAILLTKAMGAEAEVKEKVTAVLDYSDALRIPASARKYVEHVTGVGLMQGVGDNTFAPLTDVTRAQAALVLYKLQSLNGYKTFKGVVASYDADTRTIRFKLADETKAYTVIPSAVTLRCDGEAIEASDITAGWEAIVTTQSDMLAIVDFLSAQSDGTIAGKLTSVTRKGDEATVKVQYTTSDGTESVSYKTAEDVVVTDDGKEASLTSLEVGDYVRLTIKNNKITVINAEPATKTVKGTVTAIDLSDGVVMTVMINDEEQVFRISSTVKVAKNDTSAEMIDILVGDKVSLKLEYGVIKNIDATSTTVKDTGVVQSISTDANGTTIKIKIGTQVYEYPVARNAEIIVNDKSGTVHDLRINANVTITLESDTIVKLITTASDEEVDIKGEVVSTNESYRLIQVKYIDSLTGTEVTEQVFLKSNAKIISTSSNTDKKFKDIQPGMTITAMGSRSSGVFEASAIAIRN